MVVPAGLLFIYSFFLKNSVVQLKNGVSQIKITTIIIITNSYIGHFTITVSMRFTLVIGPITSLFNVSQLRGEYIALSCLFYQALVAFSYTISTSTLAGTHLPLSEEKQL